MGRRRTIDDERILDAAEAVTVEDGAARLTLDAVAKRAGISKGGLIHWFPSKEALIEAMLQREMKRFEGELVGELSPFVDKRFPRLHARIAASKRETAATRAKAAGIIMATIAQMPEHVQEVRQAYDLDLQDVDRSTEEGKRASLALVAIEGAFLVRGLGLIDLAAEDWSYIFEAIDKLIPSK